MPRSTEELLTLLDLEQLDEMRFRGPTIDSIRRQVFGGQVAGQALVAATRTMGDDRWVHSFHCYFLRPGDTSEPIEFDVQRIRDGGAFSQRRVVASQRGTTIFYLTASFHVAEESWEHQDVMPDVPAPEDCPDLVDVYEQVTKRPHRAWEREWAMVDARYIGDSRTGGLPEDPQHPARTRFWIRSASPLPDDPTIHRCVLAYASDLGLLNVSLVPHGTAAGASNVRTASLDHAMWFHRPFRADQWLLYDQVSPSAYGATGLSIGRVFTRDGALAATAAQEALIRRLGDAPE